MKTLKWYLEGLPLAARLVGEMITFDRDRPLPTARLRDDIDAYRARRP